MYVYEERKRCSVANENKRLTSSNAMQTLVSPLSMRVWVQNHVYNEYKNTKKICLYV